MSESEPPKPSGLPFVGNTIEYLRDPCDCRERWVQTFGDIVSMEILGMDMYMIAHPDLIEQVLKTDHEQYQKVESTKKQLERTIGNGLLLSDGEFWRRQRQLIQPAFYRDRIVTYTELMSNCAHERSADWQPGVVYDIEDEMRNITLRVLVRTLFGMDVGVEQRELIRRSVKDLMSRTQPSKLPIVYFVPDWVPIPINRRYNRGIRNMNRIMDDLIEERRAADEGDDLLSWLIRAETDDGHQMSNETLRDEMMTMLFAGHETTALVLTFAWELLARNRDVRETFHNELDRELDGEPPTMADLPALSYTENIINEVLRLYPPAHDIRRNPVTDVEIGGYTVPEGSIVTMPLWVVHRDERWWDDPARFNPERWAENADQRTFSYVPFGGGPRNCVGKRFAMIEAQLALATIGQHYVLDCPDDGPLDIVAGVTLQPRDGAEMVVRER